jgi:peptidoglycan/xylan/chitin deacetylase (PgdA/CDA1 family)
MVNFFKPHNWKVLAAVADVWHPMRPMGIRFLALSVGLAAALMSAPSRADVITRLPTEDKVVALTFDACMAHEPATFDHSILDVLVQRKIPFTVFASGRFVENNLADIEALSKLDFVDIENHSWDHPNNMDRFRPEHVVNQVDHAAEAITTATGRGPQFFRFPAGNYNEDGLKAVEAIGYHVVHWRWASGDPDRHESANALVNRVAEKTRPGDILIFHINGRGWHTGEALPRILDTLQGEGYRFVLVSDYVGVPHPHSGGLVDPLAAAGKLITSVQSPPLPITPGGVVN